jgi:dTDP-4-dehydrorhamnose reductase
LEAGRVALRLLITGASGLYGSKLAQLAIAEGMEVFSSDVLGHSQFGRFVQMDVSAKDAVNKVFQTLQPDAVVHAASLTDVDKCETTPELAYKVNVDGTQNITDAAEAVGAFLFYVSTDYVFSGKKGCYKETDALDPINYYGVTKQKAEAIVQTYRESCIVRPSVIYGSTPAAGKVNFALWLIETLRKGNRVRIVTDQYNTPTLNTNLAEMTLEILQRRLTGIFHLCGATRVSRLEFATQIADTFGLDKPLIDPVSSAQFTWPAKRPMDSSLDTTKAQATLKHPPLPLALALAQLKLELTQEPSNS